MTFSRAISSNDRDASFAVARVETFQRMKSQVDPKLDDFHEKAGGGRFADYLSQRMVDRGSNLTSKLEGSSFRETARTLPLRTVPDF